MKILFISLMILAAGLAGCNNDPTPGPGPGEGSAKSVALTIREDRRNNIQVTENADGTITLTPTGADAYLFFDIPQSEAAKYDIDTYTQLAFESINPGMFMKLVMFVGTENNNGLIDFNSGYYIPQSEDWVENSFDITIAPSSPKYSQFVRVRFNDGARGSFKIKNPVLREKNKTDSDRAEAEKEQDRNDSGFSDRLKTYLAQSFTSEITSVEGNWGNASNMTVKGNYNGSGFDNVYLAEIGMWDDPTDIAEPLTLEPLTTASFTKTFTRFADDAHDRLLSSWAIVKKNGEKYELLSPARYVGDNITPKNNYERFAPANKKGLGGCDMNHSDVRDLGFTSMTTNIILRDVLQPSANGTYEYAGKKWQTGDISRLDTEIKKAYENNMMVSVILLIHTRFLGTDEWTKLVSHPEGTTAGIWSMPNMLDKDGVEAYAATINFLAERYSGSQYGRIHHWICHNEIDGGWFWTDAGNKRIETYMNLYQRSMRMVQTLARQYDPNARALISLTQHWNRNDKGEKDYNSRDCLNLMSDFSRKDGDFDWGIAFHPYPQDLTVPETWNDSRATYSFATEYITPKNLEVINDFAELPHMKYNGQTARDIQFTEQGVSSPSYSDADLKKQAAALAWCFGKLTGNRLNNVSAFQHHIWGDYVYDPARRFRAGLRTFDFEYDGKTARSKKPSWEVFRKWCDDPQGYETLTDEYKDLIPGIDRGDDWTKVQHAARITGTDIGTIHFPVGAN